MNRSPPKLSDVLAATLLREIREDLSPGTRLSSERELMARFGAGRSTIREVINGLAILGVLEIRAGQGAFVADPEAGTAQAPHAIAAALTRGVTADLFEAAGLIEVSTARLAARRRTAADLDALTRVVNAHAEAIVARQPVTEQVLRFHIRLARAARNELLAEAAECITQLLHQRGAALERLVGYREWELGEHCSVLAAVTSADPERAAAQMRAHLDELVAWHDELGTASGGHSATDRDPADSDVVRESRTSRRRRRLSA